jgi:hypothetical protein
MVWCFATSLPQAELLSSDVQMLTVELRLDLSAHKSFTPTRHDIPFVWMDLCKGVKTHLLNMHMMLQKLKLPIDSSLLQIGMCSLQLVFLSVFFKPHEPLQWPTSPE